VYRSSRSVKNSTCRRDEESKKAKKEEKKVGDMANRLLAQTRHVNVGWALGHSHIRVFQVDLRVSAPRGVKIRPFLSLTPWQGCRPTCDSFVTISVVACLQELYYFGCLLLLFVNFLLQTVVAGRMLPFIDTRRLDMILLIVYGSCVIVFHVLFVIRVHNGVRNKSRCLVNLLTVVLLN